VKTTVIAAAIALLTTLAVAQTLASRPADATFDAASVKLNRDGGSVAGLRRLPGGRFEATNIQLSTLISFAYQLQNYELQGAPSWADTDRWNVIAKMNGDPPPVSPGAPDPMMTATRALLAERFKLLVHQEMKDTDVYLLVKARADGRLGPGLQRSTFDCLGLQKSTDEAARGGPAPPNPNTPDHMVCGMRVSIGRVQFGGRPLSTFMNVLTTLTQRRVVDRTGLSGDWQFDISFAPPPAAPGIQPPIPDSNAASLFTVLQESLGLKLEAARVPMPVMVVDRVERPAQD
jgi:uncharacterized protein (TIGR03435 family)